MEFVAGNAQHIGARPEQQDAFGFSDPGNHQFVTHAGFLGIVADGMGGLAHGSAASQTAVMTFLRAYGKKLPRESIPDALLRCLHEANNAVLGLAEKMAPQELGTTLVAAVLHQSRLYWISCGDSRAYLARGQSLTRLNADHILAQELNRQAAEGSISLAAAQNHPERGSLTSYLGQREIAHVDRNQQPFTVRPDDCVVLCSDGLYRAMEEEAIAAAFQGDPQLACGKLVQQALAKQRKQQDNLTIIALKHRSKAKLVLKSKPEAAIQRSNRRARAAAIITLLICLSTGSGFWYGRHIYERGDGESSSQQTSTPAGTDTPTAS
ncbi:MAG TPA: protein phosphatase 2C domain-containing protein, partial [Candidatus Angelobacter sp.]|nr:protein phosphatase 2C domain-containing protein [Candidatus Angelobacter sp.]